MLRFAALSGCGCDPPIWISSNSAVVKDMKVKCSRGKYGCRRKVSRPRVVGTTDDDGEKSVLEKNFYLRAESNPIW